MLNENGEKRCSNCGFFKSKDNFGSYTKCLTDGLYCRCKQCVKLFADEYKITPKGRAATAWYHLTQRCLNKRGDCPTYANVECRITRAEFIAWYIPEVSKFLEEFPNGKPSVDRINDDGHYELGNIQIIEFGENSRKCKRNKNIHAKKGEAWCWFHKTHEPKEKFSIDKSKPNGRCGICKSGASEYKKQNKLKKELLNEQRIREDSDGGK